MQIVQVCYIGIHVSQWWFTTATPVKSEISVSADTEYTMPAYSLSVIRISKK